MPTTKAERERRELLRAIKARCEYCTQGDVVAVLRCDVDDCRGLRQNDGIQAFEDAGGG